MIVDVMLGYANRGSKPSASHTHTLIDALSLDIGAEQLAWRHLRRRERAARAGAAAKVFADRPARCGRPRLLHTLQRAALRGVPPRKLAPEERRGRRAGGRSRGGQKVRKR
eukprot:799263-Prymnesium_polylepis.2